MLRAPIHISMQLVHRLVAIGADVGLFAAAAHHDGESTPSDELLPCYMLKAVLDDQFRVG